MNRAGLANDVAPLTELLFVGMNALHTLLVGTSNFYHTSEFYQFRHPAPAKSALPCLEDGMT